MTSTLFLPADQSRSIDLGGAQVTIRVPGEATGGAYALLEYCPGPGAGAGLHVHHREEETFYILDGEMTFQLDQEQHQAGAGAIVRIPKGLRHAFRNTTDAPARMLIMLTPAGLEHFFEDLAALLAAHPDGPSAQDLRRLADKYQVDFLPS